MNNRMTKMAIVLGIVFGGIIMFNLIKALIIKHAIANYKPPAVSVSSAIAQTVDWQPTINTIGNFLALNGVDISSQASGNVVDIAFESGQYIKRGAPLITLDDSIEQAILKSDQSQLTLKELNYKRQTDLFSRGATPSSSVDEAKANLQQAQAKVEQTQAQINHKHIGAPFDGRLGIRQVNLGQYIIPGQTSIVSLQSLDPLYLEFYLPEQLYKRIMPNQIITFTVEEFPTMLFEGKITALNSKIDLSTHNVQIQAILPNCPVEALSNPTESTLIKTRPEIRGSKLVITCDTAINKKNDVRNYAFIPGMFSSIKISQPIEPNTVIVPSTAISYSLYGNSVYLIEKENDSMTVKRVFVTTGEQQGNYTVIKKGIKGGQLVVSTGDIKLKNGTQVTINNDVKLNETSNPEALGQ